MKVNISNWLYENIDLFSSNDRINLLRKEDWKAIRIKPKQIENLPKGTWLLDNECVVQTEGSELEPSPSPRLVTRAKDIRRIPSSTAVQTLVDRPTEATGAGSRIAVIDTGLTAKTDQWRHQTPKREKVRGLTVRDWHGHGTHVASLAAGAPVESPYGFLTGIAPDAEIVSIKAFNPAGWTSTKSVLEGMKAAVELECDIINISSGSIQYDGIHADAEHDFIAEHQDDHIFVAAAGNTAREWGITQPAVSPHSIAVSSVSLSDNGLSYFSATGPQGEYYQYRPEEYEEMYSQYGDDLIKPDVVAPGGGRKERGRRPIEVITSSMSGWYEGYYDARYDSYGGAQGTSQAAPLVSGLVALLREEGLVGTGADFKRTLAGSATKNPDIGYGLPTLSRFG
tara:strand:+ start:1519 stop:2706 length:1188 start_codon:yes stop_codon:yes gene_type:complete